MQRRVFFCFSFVALVAFVAFRQKMASVYGVPTLPLHHLCYTNVILTLFLYFSNTDILSFAALGTWHFDTVSARVYSLTPQVRHMYALTEKLTEEKHK